MPKVKFFLSLKIQLFIFCLFAFIPIVLISSYLFHEHTKSVLEHQLKDKLLSITSIATDKFDINEIKKLQKPEHANTKEYKKIKNELISIKSKITYIKNISIITKKDNDNAFYVLDTSEKTEDLNKDGRIFPKTEGLVLLGDESNHTKISTESGMLQGFDKVTLSNISYTDKSGTWLRAYAPILDQYKKTTNSVISVDMYIHNANEENESFLELFKNIFIISFIIISILLFISVKLFLYPIKKLIEKIYKITKGQFDEKIPFSWVYGEVGELVDSVNQMSDDLKEYYTKAELGKEQLSEKQKIIEITTQQIKSKNYQLNNTILTLNSINELVEELIAIKDTEELMNTVLPSTIQLIKADKGFIIEYLPEQKEFKVINCFNTNDTEINDIFPINDNLYLKKIIETKNYINISEIGKIKEEEFKTALMFPLLLEKELRGIMCIMNKNEDKAESEVFSETDETTVRTLSKLVAAVWESIHLFEMATVDNLSKLYVRRYLEKSLEEEIRKSSRNHTQIGVIMVDIDNLQKCNNNYGHFVGDQVIKQVAEQIKINIDDIDLAARYGGEKLVVYMPEKTSDDANNIAEEIRTCIENMEVAVPIGDNLKVTVSIGISAFPHNGNTTEDLIRSAEEALYVAKREGKNRIVISE